MNFKKDDIGWLAGFLSVLFLFAILASILVHLWSSKEFKNFYLWRSNGEYCVYQNVENDMDVRAYCSTNPEETLRVYESLRKK